MLNDTTQQIFQKGIDELVQVKKNIDKTIAKNLNKC